MEELLKGRQSQAGKIKIIVFSTLVVFFIILGNHVLDKVDQSAWIIFKGVLHSVQPLKRILFWTSFFGLVDLPNFSNGGTQLNVLNFKAMISKIEDSTGSIQPLKRILFWTPLYRHTSLPDYFIFEKGRLSQKSFCKYHCEFTTNKSLLNSSHAILFHSRDLEISGSGGKETPSDLPQHRNSDQYWIIYMIEPPTYTYADLDLFAGIFNLTLTYRRDSDIYAPYRRLVGNSYKRNFRMASVQEELKSKTKLVAWIVSNCHSKGAREALVYELRNYLAIDIFGKCMNHSCPPTNRDSSNCYQEIGKSYKFYLSLENSYCYDYVTEKFFNALDAGMVPIVYGGADYLRHAPEGSFIHVNSFPSVKALAEYILMLDQNLSEYIKYFDWKKKFYVDLHYGLSRAWCSLCEKLTTQNLPRQKVVKDLEDWWFNIDNSSACVLLTNLSGSY